MIRQFNQIRQTRKNSYLVMRELDKDQLITIPEGFNNNILWNFGHMLVTQQILCYKLTGNEFILPQEIITAFAKGSSPEQHISPDTFNLLKEWSRSTIDQLQMDYESGLFKEFTPYETSFGLTLNSIEDAISFNAVHESMHLGYIMALKRAL